MCSLHLEGQKLPFQFRHRAAQEHLEEQEGFEVTLEESKDGSSDLIIEVEVIV